MVAIGGVGGSGTRIVAEILRKCGYFIGNDLNVSNDNLLFTLLFKRENILLSTDEEFKFLYNTFINIMKQDINLSNTQNELLRGLSENDRTLHNKEWLLQSLEHLEHDEVNSALLGWKEPNTHIVIEKLFHLNKDLKFIYVFRNGLDMAYSSNQNQLKLWGDISFNEKDIDITPANSLRYWVIVHKRMLELQKSYPKRMIMLDFDLLCKSPEVVLNEFSEFINYNKDIIEFKDIIKRPDSIGRHKEFSLENFHPEDLNFVKNIYDN